jgi:hypothetical protein
MPDGSVSTGRVFAVESWGCAGTNWLTRALDGHPEIRCFHALNGDYARATRSPRLEGLDYVELLELQRLDYAVVGDVHGFARTSIEAVQAALGDRFRCVVLVRDPLPRYRSQLALFKHEDWRRWTPNGRLWDIDYVKPIAAAAGIDLPDDDYDQMLVVHAACMLNVILEERRLGPVVRMEDLVSSADALRSLARTLTAGEVSVDGFWADDAVARPPLRRHARGEELTAHELDVLERVVEPAAWALYRDLGYDC